MGPRRVEEETDFGQSIFGGGAPKGGGGGGQTQKKWGPEGWGPQRWGPQGLGPKISRFSLATVFRSSLPSLLVFFVEFWWCLKRRCAQMCTFGVLGLLCEAPAANTHTHTTTHTQQQQTSKKTNNTEHCFTGGAPYLPAVRLARSPCLFWNAGVALGRMAPHPPQLTWCGRPVLAFPRREVALF